MSLSRFLTSTHFRQQVQRSYALHRDFKACLSLKQAQKIVEERSAEIKEFGKTAFLQFLNSFPLNYSYKMLNGPLKIYLFSLQLKDLSIYEQQLRYSIFIKLREYVCNVDKPATQEHLDRAEQALLERIKVTPFDTTHALNFLHFQKDNKNNELFYHCLEVIRRTEYRILETVMPKFLMVFVKRLSLEEWNIIRKFKYFTDSIIFDFVPKNFHPMTYIYLYENMCKLQLHTVGYLKVPPAIDFILGYFMTNLENPKVMDPFKLNILFKCFDYLPIGYNQHAFNTIYQKILQKPMKDTIYMDNLPYRRLSKPQIDALFNRFCAQQFNFSYIIYVGNLAPMREEFLKSSHPKTLHSEYLQVHPNSRRNFFSYLVSAAILMDYYKDDSITYFQIKETFKKVMSRYDNDCNPHTYIKYFSLSNVFNMMRLNHELGGLYDRLVERLLQEQLSRSRNEDFKELKYNNNVMEAVNLFADTPIREIRKLMIEILMNIKRKQDKFYYDRYSAIVFKLLRSPYSKDYREVVRQLLSLIAQGDCPHFVEIYNRAHGKTHKLHFQLLKLLSEIDGSFACMGKFMVTSSYSHFTSPRGELILDYRKIIEAIEPMLNIQDLKEYVLPEMTAILRFCNHFYFFMSEFARKLLLIAMEHAEGLDITRDGGKFLMQFIQEAIRLKIRSNAGNVVNPKCIALIKKAKEAFPDNILLKTKELQFLNMLGEANNDDRTALIVDEILSELSSSNYSSKHADVMVLLLKLHCMEAIQLKEVVVEKLQSLVEMGLEQNEIKVNDVMNQLYLPSKRQGGQRSQKLGRGLVRLLSLCLDKTAGKHNFEFYMQFVDLAHYLRSHELVAKGFDNLCHPVLYVHHIKRIVNLLKFYRNISCDLLVQRLLQEALLHFDYLQAEIPQILYSCHFLKNQISSKQLANTHSILDKFTQYLTETKEIAKKEGVVLKFLWVCFKTKKTGPSLMPIFQMAIDFFKDIRDQFSKGNFEGITTQNIAYIYLSIAKQLQLKGYSQGQHKVEKKGMFKNKKTVTTLGYIRQESKKLLEFLNKMFTEQDKEVLRSELGKAGFTPKQGEGSDNVYELQKNVNGIILNALVTKNGKQYGIILKRDFFYTIQKKEKGRIRFTLNTLNKITGLKVCMLEPGKELRLDNAPQ